MRDPEQPAAVDIAVDVLNGEVAGAEEHAQGVALAFAVVVLKAVRHARGDDLRGRDELLGTEEEARAHAGAQKRQALAEDIVDGLLQHIGVEGFFQVGGNKEGAGPVFADIGGGELAHGVECDMFHDDSSEMA